MKLSIENFEKLYSEIVAVDTTTRQKIIMYYTVVGSSPFFSYTVEDESPKIVDTIEKAINLWNQQ